MNLRRRTFLSWVSGGLCVAIFGRAHSQVAPSGGLPAQAGPLSYYQAIENAASSMKPDDPKSVRAVADAIFKIPRPYPMPEVMTDVAKQRLIDAQIAYLNEKTTGTPEGSVVDALNTLAAKFEMPDYAMVSLLQVQLIHMNLASLMPVLMHPETGLDIKVGEPNPPMSPLQTILVTAGLIDQKLLVADYQVPPAEWNRDIYPRLLKEELARQELRRRIRAGECNLK